MGEKKHETESEGENCRLYIYSGKNCSERIDDLEVEKGRKRERERREEEERKRRRGEKREREKEGGGLRRERDDAYQMVLVAVHVAHRHITSLPPLPPLQRTSITPG